MKSGTDKTSSVSNNRHEKTSPSDMQAGADPHSNTDHLPGSGAKGSSTEAQVKNSGMEEMLQQLHQILAQITQSIDSDNIESAIGSEDNQQLIELANQLAANLKEQSSDAGESAMQVVLQIIDTLADMLENGQICITQ